MTANTSEKIVAAEEAPNVESSQKDESASKKKSKDADEKPKAVSRYDE